jgi:hypothetical protein
VTRCDADPEEVQGRADEIALAKAAAALRLLRAAGQPLEGSFDFLVTEDVRHGRGRRGAARCAACPRLRAADTHKCALTTLLRCCAASTWRA